MSSVAHLALSVTVGVDTHRDFHVAVALDQLGRRLGVLVIPADTAGYRSLCAWAGGFGTISTFGIEGTGCYGTGLMRFLTSAGHDVLEVDRPDRKTRRTKGKSDAVDAEAAARAVLSGNVRVLPKARSGAGEELRLLHKTKRGAIKARTQALNALRAMVVTAPESLRCELKGLRGDKLIAACARLRPGQGSGLVVTNKHAMRSLARRCKHLDAEVTELEAAIKPLADETCPQLLELRGVGYDVAAQLVATMGDNAERIRSGASFAALCGVSPVDASSGNQQRHRLNRGGDRQANRVIHVVAISRCRTDERTKAYMARKRAQGKSTKEALRCLKRMIVRELYGVLKAELCADKPTDIAA